MCHANTKAIFFKPDLLIFADGEFTKPAIVDFVFANKLPLVTTFSRESASLIFENPIKKQVALCLLCIFIASTF